MLVKTRWLSKIYKLKKRGIHPVKDATSNKKLPIIENVKNY